jgi:hypothetical protein
LSFAAEAEKEQQSFAQKEMTPKSVYRVNPNETYASARGGETAVCVSFDETDNVPQSASSVQGTRGSLPSLEDLLLGADALLRMSASSRVKHMDDQTCRDVHRKLRDHGCTSTAHLVQLYEFYCGANGTRQEQSPTGADRTKLVMLLMKMGIGAFHAMELVQFVESVLVR